MRQIARFVTADNGEVAAISMDGKRAVTHPLFGFACYTVEGDGDRRTATKMGQTGDRHTCYRFLKGENVPLTPPISGAIFRPLGKQDGY